MPRSQSTGCEASCLDMSHIKSYRHTNGAGPLSSSTTPKANAKIVDRGSNADPGFVAAMAIAIVAAATIAGAWFFQLVLDIRPCPLCLEQRYAYYLAIPLAVLLAVGVARRAPRGVLIVGFAVLSLAALANAWLGTYHAGVEWGWWKGPSDCTGPLTDFGSPGNLLEGLKTVKVIRCDDVQWRFLGLSLAGYNALISLLMAAIALWGLRGLFKTR